MSRESGPQPDGRFEGSEIAEPAFSGDDGAAQAQVQQALADYANDPAKLPEALMALQASRLVVPVVAVAGEVSTGPEGLPVEKESDMATVLMQGADGRLALLAFTGVTALARWDADARPVPVGAGDAAKAAVAEGAVAMVVDIAGPVPVPIEGDDLQGFAQGWTLGRLGSGPGSRTAWFQ